MFKKSIFLFLLVLFLKYHSCILTSSLLEFKKDKAADFWYYECASYCSQSQLSIWNVSSVSEKYPQITDIEVIFESQGSNQAYVAYDPLNNVAFLAFRGTTNLENWIEDLQVTTTPVDYCDGCRVHSGMLAGYLGMKDQVEAAIVKLKEKHKDAEFALIGHSLGSVFATLAFLDFYEIMKPNYFYTFGLPRMGNQQFADFVDSSHPEILKARMTHYKDIVPRTPLQIMGYSHFKTEIYFDEDFQNYIICEEAEDSTGNNQFSEINFSITDHRLWFGLNVHIFKYSCQ